MEHAEFYNEGFYLDQKDSSYRSATIVLDFLFRYYCPKSVVDVGCGLGTWLKVCREKGVKTIKGYDVNEMPADQFFIDRNLVEIIDLEKPVAVSQTYDLALSVEVAEHIDPGHTERYLDYLTALSDVILFSAANPHQLGMGHVNEQPPTYWSERFGRRQFLCFDLLRPTLMNVEGISWWYRQNLLLFVHEKRAGRFREQGLAPVESPMYLYHPERFFILMREYEQLRDRIRNRRLSVKLRKLLGTLPGKGSQ
jgi:SAM-dependent methyltransferase